MTPACLTPTVSCGFCFYAADGLPMLSSICFLEAGWSPCSPASLTSSLSLPPRHRSSASSPLCPLPQSISKPQVRAGSDEGEVREESQSHPACLPTHGGTADSTLSHAFAARDTSFLGFIRTDRLLKPLSSVLRKFRVQSPKAPSPFGAGQTCVCG